MHDKKLVKYEDDFIEFEDNGVMKVKDSTYAIFEDGSRKVVCYTIYDKPTEDSTEPEPTEQDLVQAEILLALTKQQNQLNAIEAKLNQ